MVDRTVFHVIPIVGSQWRVTPAGGGQEHLFDTKAQAVEAGRRLARKARPSQLVIHHAAGQIETEHTFGDE